MTLPQLKRGVENYDGLGYNKSRSTSATWSLHNGGWRGDTPGVHALALGREDRKSRGKDLSKKRSWKPETLKTS